MFDKLKKMVADQLPAAEELLQKVDLSQFSEVAQTQLKSVLNAMPAGEFQKLQDWVNQVHQVSAKTDLESADKRKQIEAMQPTETTIQFFKTLLTTAIQHATGSSEGALQTVAKGAGSALAMMNAPLLALGQEALKKGLPPFLATAQGTKALEQIQNVINQREKA